MGENNVFLLLAQEKEKFRWNDNWFGRHIKAILRTEGKKLKLFHVRFQPDVMWDNVKHLGELFGIFAV